MSRARRILPKHRMIPVIDIRLPLWGFSELPDRTAMQRAIEGALSKLKPVRRFLQTPLGK